MTTKEAAAAVGVSAHTLYTYLKAGVAGTKDDGDRWTLTPKDVKVLQKHKASVKHGRPYKTKDE